MSHAILRITSPRSLFYFCFMHCIPNNVRRQTSYQRATYHPKREPQPWNPRCPSSEKRKPHNGKALGKQTQEKHANQHCILRAMRNLRIHEKRPAYGSTGYSTRHSAAMGRECNCDVSPSCVLMCDRCTDIDHTIDSVNEFRKSTFAVDHTA